MHIICFKRILSSLLITSLLLSACSTLPGIGGGQKKITIQIIYGSEKQEWLQTLTAAFNETHPQTPDGALIEVQSTAMGSIESIEQILAGHLQPTVWSPASSLYIPIANSEWRKNHSDDLINGTPKDLVLSPVVIAMWKPMAEALGWPDKAIGWSDIARLATANGGWKEFGYPEWGDFKFGHTHPDFSNSGIVAVIAQAYTGSEKQRDLTIEDLKKDGVRDFMASVQTSIIHYGTSTGFFAERMFERGPSYLSAAVLYENLVISQENKRLAGSSSQLAVTAIYPKEGTFWANHPYIMLNAPWVTPDQRQAAEIFQNYLLARPQQVRAIELGFRPADPAIPLTAPLDAQHGVDPKQPHTILQIPKTEVIYAIQELWKEVKKPVDLVAVIDTSGSMKGDKISSARVSLLDFMKRLSDRDRLGIITFNDTPIVLSALSPLGKNRLELSRRVSAISEAGNTSFYDATDMAYQHLLENGDPNHIRAVVVLSDGKDTASLTDLQNIIRQIGINSEEGGNAIKVFTIAYGSDADTQVLKDLSEATGGKMFESKPDTIQQIYAEIATFF